MLLEIKGLVASVDGEQMLRGIDLEVQAAERVGIIGESGSGKSMLALSIMGLTAREIDVTGSVRLAGNELLRGGEKQLSRVRGGSMAMIFQEPTTALNPVMRVGKQVGEAYRIHAHCSRSAAGARARELLEEVGLRPGGQMMTKYPHELSGGQRQRVMIAMAVANQPRLIIADEPTTALDVTVQARILETLVGLTEQEGIALILVSHDLAVVTSVCTRVAVMYGGLIVEEGITSEILSRPAHPYTQALIATSRGFEVTGQSGGRLPVISGNVPSIGEFPSGCVFRGRCPYESSRCQEVPPVRPGGHMVRCWHPVDQEMQKEGERV